MGGFTVKPRKYMRSAQNCVTTVHSISLLRWKLLKFLFVILHIITLRKYDHPGHSKTSTAILKHKIYMSSSKYKGKHYTVINNFYLLQQILLQFQKNSSKSCISCLQTKANTASSKTALTEPFNSLEMNFSPRLYKYDTREMVRINTLLISQAPQTCKHSCTGIF